jgi:hypothetical protein
MATGALLVIPYIEFADEFGEPLNGGLVYSYLAGSDTPSPLYTDETLTVEHPNPLELDSAGREIAYVADLAYKLIVRKADGTLVRTVPHVRIAPPTLSDVAELDRLVILSI